jgi:hypothetical protein
VVTAFFTAGAAAGRDAGCLTGCNVEMSFIAYP